MPRSRRHGLVGLVLCLLSLGCGGRESPPTAPVRRASPSRPQVPVAPPPLPPCPQKPNILIVSVDTLRFDATTLDPASRRPTPFLTELQRQGINFTRCYSTHDSTPSSHFSMLTGFITGLKSDFDVPEVSLAHQLGSRGYRTFGVAANGNLSGSLMRSFSPFRRFVNLYEVWEKLSPEKKAAAGRNAEKRLRTYGYELADLNLANRFATFDVVLDRAEPLLKGSQPFFGFINVMEMHDPYVPDPRIYNRASEHGTKVPDLRFRQVSPELADPASIPDEARRQEVTQAIRTADGRAWSTTFDLTPRMIAIYKKRYFANAAAVDDGLRRLFDFMVQERLLDSTIVIITSDHGESFGEKHLITHSFGDAGDMRATHAVPLLLIFPTCYGYGARKIATPSTIADIPPTLYDLLGIDPEPIWSKSQPGNFGRSLRPLFANETRMATVADTKPARPMTAAEKKAQDDEALKRFRALGYIH